MRTQMVSALGGAKTYTRQAKVIRFAKYGCTNRPFLHVVVTQRNKGRQEQVIEQLGTYDPLVNVHGEKLCSLNLERIGYWVGKGAQVSNPCSILFGLAGFFPIHPRTYILAWRNRRQAAKEDTTNGGE